MTDAISHRGPDGDGFWSDENNRITLGHRRLAIIDLSPAGKQPMISESGRYTISFNGEVYNFQELRRQLAEFGHRFNGHSDTEVMLAAFERWGLVDAVERFCGMFAFALWDSLEKTLHLVRDRLGKKPIYYFSQDEEVVFASELKSLRTHPTHKFEVDRTSLTQYLRFQYVPAPRSIYRDVCKVNPAEIVSFVRRGGSVSKSVKTYWSAADVYERAARNPFKGTIGEAEAELDHLIAESVRQRMISDVPLGAFLSGGIDSSLVVAYMQRQSSQAVRTFSIGFAEAAFDESKHAAQVAGHLRTRHTELTVSSDAALSVIPSLASIYDEPFGDSSQIPTYLVAKLAREHVTVALSGDGGDELFCGYNRYFWQRQLWPLMSRVPLSMRHAIGRWVLRHDSARWDNWLRPAMRVLPRARRRGNPGMLVRKAGESLLASGPQSLYLGFVSHWRSPLDMVIRGHEPTTLLDAPWPTGQDASTAHMSLLDLLTYLPNDILVKVDRATMANSLEARCPLLDHRLAEFAARLPMKFKISEGRGKAILRHLLYRHVPREIVDRPKTGFGIPLAAWLRGPLREWADALLSRDRLQNDGFFHSASVRETWEAFLSNRVDSHYQLWTVLMFQAWLDEWHG